MSEAQSTPSMRYATIVVDPPWEAPDVRGGGVSYGKHGFSRRQIPYPTMGLDEIAALGVSELAQPHAHLYLWTTQFYLPAAFDVVKSWGFRYVNTLVWCKPIRGWTVGGTFMSTTEFVLFCRRGSLKSNQRIDRQWFEWRRGEHSAKPEAFMDMVELVSPGPYLELFARRNRLGWDTWGDEALKHVEVDTRLPALARTSSAELRAQVDAFCDEGDRIQPSAILDACREERASGL